MKKYVKANYSTSYLPSEYLISCLQDGLVSEREVLSEFMSFCSEDDIQAIIESLGLNEIEEE